ncbi:MAG: hypothetical protein M3Z09_18130 [Acidobacteriota bacterium]|nr:hypothetical protein [Acidobacteriota bacterium]
MDPAKRKVAAKGLATAEGEEEEMSLTDEDKQWFTALLERLEARMDAKLEGVETGLLTEFHQCASPLEMRMRTHTAALRAVDAEMEDVSDRAAKLEKQ